MTSLLRFGYSPPASGTMTPLGWRWWCCTPALAGGQIAGDLPLRAEISWDPALQLPVEGEVICKKMCLIKAG